MELFIVGIIIIFELFFIILLLTRKGDIPKIEIRKNIRKIKPKVNDDKTSAIKERNEN